MKRKWKRVTDVLPMGEFILDGFVEINLGNLGKYKIDEQVVYIGDFIEFYGKEFRIRASSTQDENSTEYCLEGFPFLVYEEELTRKEEEK